MHLLKMNRKVAKLLNKTVLYTKGLEKNIFPDFFLKKYYFCATLLVI